ncbi:MAG TPA: SgcJ/EcaC family oxidoreductase [Acidobacteriaceae bacterium]|nr:SgcJ/EcaC family oxidoreductase [Acidobacteriaceae bacterium]
MNRVITFCAVSMLAAGLTACNQAPAPTTNAGASNHDADVQAIRDNEKQWNQHFVSKDVSKLAGHYTDDAVLMTPGEETASGKSAIQKRIEDLVKDPAFSLRFQSSTVDVANSGDLGYSRGTYTMTMTDPKTKKPMTDHGGYVTEYRKQSDGTWKAVADSVVSEVPMVPPAPMKMKH